MLQSHEPPEPGAGVSATSPTSEFAARHEPLLAGQVAVITGGGRGIGRAIACRFASEGASVVCAARTARELDATVAAIHRDGGDGLAVVTDVRDPDAVEALVERAVGSYGRLDLAVLGAGTMPPPAPVDQVPLESWQSCVETNLTGVFHGLRAVVPHLRDAGGGKVIVIGSAAARRAPEGLAPYAMSKAGLTALVRVAARDLRRYRIAVNELQPGPTATALHGVQAEDPDTLAEREVVLSGEGLEDDRTLAGEWFKSPRNVAEFALHLATLPKHGPSGQVFSYNSAV
jgi:3-oxoacyl-[acyl-carrier protein] reductase